MKMQRYRRKRRLNPVRFLVFLLTLGLAVALSVLVFRTGLFGLLGKGATTVASAAGELASVDGASGKNAASDGVDGSAGGAASDASGEAAAQAAASPSAAPTPRPTADPVRAASTKKDDIDVKWTDPAVFDGANAWPDAVSTLALPGGASLSTWTIRNGKPATDAEVAAANTPISFGLGSDYTKVEGVLAFRGNNFRDQPSWGTRSVTQKKLEIVWTKDIGSIHALNTNWPGTGWTGQPLLVHWPEQTRKIMNVSSEFKHSDLVEVIYPTLDGNIYFLDLATGRKTREPIKTGYSFKGTGAVDPRGYPMLYAGQGLNENNGKYTEFKYRVYSLIDQTEMWALFGVDKSAFRGWGAFDSSALISGDSDTLIECGENGLVSRIRLNTDYNPAAGTLSVAPQVTQYRYHASWSDELGIENSPAAYGGKIWFNDNGGTLQCVDINAMKPVWAVNTGDDSDATTTLEKDGESLWLYTANQVDKRHKEGGASTLPCNIRKINADTGAIEWQTDISCVYNYYINGGALGTPLVGKDDISDLILFNIAFTGSNSDGALLALDKKTGAIVWKRQLQSYSWCSPVGIRSDDGKTWGIFTDNAGLMHLFDPKTGKDVSTLSLGANVESSPSVYNDMIVIGSYAQKIYGIRIR